MVRPLSAYPTNHPVAEAVCVTKKNINCHLNVYFMTVDKAVRKQRGDNNNSNNIGTSLVSRNFRFHFIVRIPKFFLSSL